MMLQVAFNENRQLIVQEAQDRLKESRHQEQLTQDREKLDNNMVDLYNRIELMTSSRSNIVGSIDRWRRAELKKQLDQIGQDLTAEEKKLADLPGTIFIIQEQMHFIARQAQAIRSREQPIPGSADVHRQEIEAVD
jgi:chromosome segregation ATPase